MSQFNLLIKEQFTYGGKKYAMSASKESTDVLFDRYSDLWLYGTMDKYCQRFRNLERERDLLKIACYCYILWLKRGFWGNEVGKVHDTSVALKDLHFDKFINLANDYYILKNGGDFKITIDSVSKLIYDMADKRFNGVTQSNIFEIYSACRLIWAEKYLSAVTHDTDTPEDKK